MHFLRIISGIYRGRKLEKIEAPGIRPTSDRVREALFSIIHDSICGSSFLDLFAGSGGVGIEAYSRGASEVIFVDLNKESIKVLKNNIKSLGLLENVEVYNTDCLNAISKLSDRGKRFNFIFMDPPYKSGFYIEAIKKIYEKNILSDAGVIIIEQDSKGEIEDYIDYYKLIKKKIYGNTTLLFYAKRTL